MVTLQMCKFIVTSPSHTDLQCQSETKANISLGWRYQSYPAKMHAYSAEAKIRLYQSMI